MPNYKIELLKLLVSSLMYSLLSNIQIGKGLHFTECVEWYYTQWLYVHISQYLCKVDITILENQTMLNTCLGSPDK